MIKVRVIILLFLIVLICVIIIKKNRKERYLDFSKKPFFPTSKPIKRRIYNGGKINKNGLAVIEGTSRQTEEYILPTDIDLWSQIEWKYIGILKNSEDIKLDVFESDKHAEYLIQNKDLNFIDRVFIPKLQYGLNIKGLGPFSFYEE